MHPITSHYRDSLLGKICLQTTSPHELALNWLRGKLTITMTRTNPKKRLKRFEVTKDRKVPFRMQDRDREIIKHIHDNRFLTTKLISLLVGSSEQVTRTRLMKLFQNKYIDRKKGEHNKSTVYYLVNKAYVEVLNPYYGIDKPSARMTEKNRSVTYDPFLNHELLIAKTRVTLTLALKNRLDASLSEWVPDKERTNKYTVLREGGREEDRTFAPDSFITIRIDDEDIFFFLEADRHTKDNDRFRKQMRKYWEYRSAWKEEMGTGDDGEYFGFRVLIVALSEAKVNNLRKVTREADDKGVGSEMYWFTSETRFNPEDPETILKPIWQTPKDDTFHSLLD